TNDPLWGPHERRHVGTAAYMSPALAAGRAEDTRCDVYALGALLYEMLTGRPPYDGRTAEEILLRVRGGPPRPILRLNPGAPRGLVRVAEAAMARELRDRYAEMADVVADLNRVALGREPLGPHGRPPAGRRVIALVGGAAVALGLLVWGLGRPGGAA